MFTVQTERPTETIGRPAALMLGAIAALTITAFALAVPHSRHVSRPRSLTSRLQRRTSHVRFASVTGRGGGGTTTASGTLVGGRSVRAEHSYGAVP